MGYCPRYRLPRLFDHQVKVPVYIQVSPSLPALSPAWRDCELPPSLRSIEFWSAAKFDFCHIPFLALETQFKWSPYGESWNIQCPFSIILSQTRSPSPVTWNKTSLRLSAGSVRGKQTSYFPCSMFPVSRSEGISYTNLFSEVTPLVVENSNQGHLRVWVFKES